MTDASELKVLYRIVKALNESSQLKHSLHAVLEILDNSLGLIRGTITLVNPMRDEIRIEVAHGLSADAVQRGRYKPGEGITGRVIQTGKPIIVPRIQDEPSFLDRTDSQLPDDYSFICVPIRKAKRVVGALSVGLPHSDEITLRDQRRLLMVIAEMLAQHVVTLETIRREKEELKVENERLQEQLLDRHSLDNMVGSSHAMQEVFNMVSKVCRSNATVLIRGESGTGKELVAQAIHYNSLRAKKPFIKLNCAALPPELIESELFGHVKGAFTHAVRDKQGKFELANKGTIFLDEIGNIGLDVQSKLLRILQEREFERVGGTESIKADVRIIAATNKNLEEAVEAETFRDDLYYRLNVFPIYMPSLRERKTDVLQLANYFLERYAKENQKDIRRLSSSVIDMMMEYHWPGNVRELENCIERAVLLCDGNVIRGYHLPPTLQTGEESESMPTQSLENSVAKLEREMIVDALKQTRGNMSKAANMLALTERKFAYKTKKYEVDYKSYRPTRPR